LDSRILWLGFLGGGTVGVATPVELLANCVLL
jgi:hypothetical protein